MRVKKMPLVAAVALGALPPVLAPPAAANASTPPIIEFNVLQAERNQTYGHITIATTARLVPQAGTSSVCGCIISLRGVTASGQRVVIRELSANYNVTHNLSDDVSYDKGTFIELEVVATSASWPTTTASMPIDDWIRPTSASFRLATFTDSGSVTSYEVDVRNSAILRGPTCNYNACYIFLEGRKANGTIVRISTDLVTQRYAQSFHHTGSGAFTDVIEIRARVSDLNGFASLHVVSPWQPVSHSTVGGHDLDGSVALMLVSAAGISPVELACPILFPVGTHVAGSSLTDQALSCQSAVSGGTSLSTAVKTILKGLTAAGVTELLVANGVAQKASLAMAHPELDFGTLPPPCVWVGTGGAFTCDLGATFQEAISAPPVLDPQYEANKIDEMLERDPRPFELPVPIPGDAFEFAGKPDYLRLAMRTCVQQVYAPAPSGGTYGSVAGVNEGDCTDTPIFMPGREVPQVVAHRLSAISSNPVWMHLNYESSAQKITEVFPRTWYTNTAECETSPGPGISCDEYPYYSSVQGAQYILGTPSTPLVSLSWLSSTENSAEGLRYGSFVRLCRMTSGSATNPAPTGSDFLVIPSAVMPTTHVCNR